MIDKEIWEPLAVIGTAIGTVALALVNIFVLVYLDKQTKIAA